MGIIFLGACATVQRPPAYLTNHPCVGKVCYVADRNNLIARRNCPRIDDQACPVTSLLYGDAMNVLEVVTGGNGWWLRVEASGLTRYIHESNTNRLALNNPPTYTPTFTPSPTATPTQTPEPQFRYQINQASAVEARACPRMACEIVASFAPGDNFIAVGVEQGDLFRGSRDWLKIPYFEGVYVYIQANFATEID
jgi:hypothetical protein